MNDRIPNNPLAFIRACVNAGRIFWTYHINMRMAERNIPRRAVLESVDKYEIIEEYPDDKYLPSYLVWMSFKGDVLHVLFAVDTCEENVRVVTAYYPDVMEWMDGMKRRRRT